MQYSIVCHSFCFERRVQALKYKADGINLTELPASASPRTSTQTKQYHSANIWLTKRVKLFRYFK